jgi:hypothetical protein
MVKLTVVLIVLILAALCFGGCTSYSAHRMFADSDSGFVMLAGDAEGIRAYNDGLVGHITEAKTSPDVKSAYWQTREQETTMKVFKFRAHNEPKKTKEGSK